MAFGLSQKDMIVAGVDIDGVQTRGLVREQNTFSIDQIKNHALENFIPIFVKGFGIQPQEVIISTDSSSVSMEAQGLKVVLYTSGRVSIDNGGGSIEAGNISDLKKGVVELIEARVRELTQHH